jgi:AraC-like DNA-binding protein
LDKRDTMKPARGILKGTVTERVTHHRVAPRDELAFAVEHFWSVQWDLEGAPPLRAQTLPHPSVHVTIEPRRAEVGGVFTTRFVRTLRGRGWVFGLKFRPGMFHQVLGAPLSTLRDRVVPLAQVFGKVGMALTRQVRAGTFEESVAAWKPLLMRLVRDDDPVACATRDLVELAASDRTLLQVEHLVARAGVTKRTLQRQFDRYVGVSPKWVLQRYRLHEANERLLADGALDLAGLALELGYSDQSHFVRDFKAMVGVTPGSYARRGGS